MLSQSEYEGPGDRNKGLGSQAWQHSMIEESVIQQTREQTRALLHFVALLDRFSPFRKAETYGNDISNLQSLKIMASTFVHQWEEA